MRELFERVSLRNDFCGNFSRKVPTPSKAFLKFYLEACASIFFYGYLVPQNRAPTSGRKYSRLGRKILSCFRSSLFSPLSPSLAPPPAALGLQASCEPFGKNAPPFCLCRKANQTVIFLNQPAEETRVSSASGTRSPIIPTDLKNPAGTWGQGAKPLVRFLPSILAE